MTKRLINKVKKRYAKLLKDEALNPAIPIDVSQVRIAKDCGTSQNEVSKILRGYYD